MHENNYERLKKKLKMRKTILTFAMMLMMALTAAAGPTITATPANKTHVAFKGDSIVVTDGDEQVTVSGIPQKVRDKINEALDDTLTGGSGTTVEIGNQKGELAPEDIKEISNQWASVAKQWAISGSFCLLGLVALVLFFRFLNRRNKYRVIEKAIENNYPLNEISLNDTKRSAIYVQRPVVTAAPPVQPGQVPVGTPISGQTPDNPVVMTDMVNWRALMPAIRVLGWGAFLTLFGIYVAGGNDPFTVIGLALIFVGLCKGFILYKEQKALEEAWHRAEQMAPKSTPMREGTPVPPPMDNDYKEDDNTPYQPY
jgi:hypothetical protein